MSLRLRPVTFFGGKGGVGKTTMAAAAALASADAGASTLLVSTDPAHSTSDVLDRRLGSEPTPVVSGLDAMELDAASEADRYIADVKERIRQVSSPRMLKEVEREIDVARLSPGAEDAALFDRFAELMRQAGEEYDRVIFDTAPTGHTLRLLGMPEMLEGWAAGLAARRRKLGALGRMWRNVAGAAAGSRREPREDDPVLTAIEARQARFRTAREIVTDTARATFIFVLVPERLPILETRRAVDTLGRYGIPVGGVIVNRVLPLDVDGAFLARRRGREARYLAEIDDAFETLAMVRVPLQGDDVAGIEALRALGGRVGLTV